jgi:transcriptional regulator with PAS, ATPase and Fis domain
LFGHRRGAFTGADRDRKGLIRAAHGGVLFLDEIGDLDYALQTKLLRVLQEKRVLAVGDEHDVPIDVRVVAASNRNLPHMVEHGEFRADLFHRFTLTIEVPPLRKRRADIPPLIAHFVEKHRGVHAAAVSTVGADFTEAVSRLELKGNARQLENLVRWALVHKGPGGALRLSDLPPDVWKELVEHNQLAALHTPASVTPLHAAPATAARPFAHVTGVLTGVLQANGWNLSRSMKSCEKFILQAALQQANGNRDATARLLGITTRSVYNKLREHNLRV